MLSSQKLLTRCIGKLLGIDTYLSIPRRSHISVSRYYSEASICFAYLSGLSRNTNPITSIEFANHEWFTRGWTLQELVAPQEVIFYTSRWDVQECTRMSGRQQSEWTELGRKSKLGERLSYITGIEPGILSEPWLARGVSIAKRMSWAAGRKTTRVEDRAYSLMGLFGVNMPMLYGEGSKAFIRLQEEIMKESSDESIFAWRSDQSSGVQHRELVGLLAESPDMFKYSGSFSPILGLNQRVPFFGTNHGVQISLHLQHVRCNLYVAALNCDRWPGHHGIIGIYLHRVTNFSLSNKAVTYDEYERVYSDELLTLNYAIQWEDITTVFIRKQNTKQHWTLVQNLGERLVQLRKLPNPELYRLRRIVGTRVDKAQNTKEGKSYVVKGRNELAMVIIIARQDGSYFSILLGTHVGSDDIAACVLEGQHTGCEFVGQEDTFVPQPNGTTTDLGGESITVNVDSTSNIMTAVSSMEKVVPNIFFVDILVEKNEM